MSIQALEDRMRMLPKSRGSFFVHRLIRVWRDGVFYILEDLLNNDYRYFGSAQAAAVAINKMLEERKKRA